MIRFAFLLMASSNTGSVKSFVTNIFLTSKSPLGSTNKPTLSQSQANFITNINFN